MKQVFCVLLALVLVAASLTAFAEDTLYFSEQPFGFTAAEYPLELEGRKVYGVLYLPEGDGPFPTIIFSHGFNGSEGSWAHVAKILANSGFACYAFDFRGGNTLKRSSGKTTEMSALTEKADLTEVMHLIQREAFCDASRLYLAGESLGGLVTVLTAAEFPEEVAGVFLIYPALTVPETTRQQYASEDDIPARPRFSGVAIGKQFYTDVMDIDINQALDAYPGSILILHGDADALVSMEAVQEIAARHAQCAFIIMPGEGHGFTPEGKTETAKQLYQFCTK